MVWKEEFTSSPEVEKDKCVSITNMNGKEPDIQEEKNGQKTNLVPAKQTFCSHHDSQHKPNKRPTKHPDAAPGKLQARAQHLGFTNAKSTPWVSTVLAQRLYQTEGKWGTQNMLNTTVNKMTEPSE